MTSRVSPGHVMRWLPIAALVLHWPLPLVAAPPVADLAVTPPMGRNSWTHCGAKVTNANVRAAAKAVVAPTQRAYRRIAPGPAGDQPAHRIHACGHGWGRVWQWGALRCHPPANQATAP